VGKELMWSLTIIFVNDWLCGVLLRHLDVLSLGVGEHKNYFISF